MVVRLVSKVQTVTQPVRYLCVVCCVPYEYALRYLSYIPFTNTSATSILSQLVYLVTDGHL